MDYTDSDGKILRVELGDYGAKFYSNLDNQLHRLDGPAVEYEGKYINANEYYLEGVKLSKEEWEKKVSKLEHIDSDGQKLYITECLQVIRYFNAKQQLHRLDGPAVKWKDGSYQFYKNGHLHRLYGPSAYYIENDCYTWHIEGKLHNTEGPAKVWKKTGKEEYWLDDEKLTKEEWEKKVLEMKAKENTYIDSDGKILTILKNEYNGETNYYNSAGNKHRLDGPAVENKEGLYYAWYINGKRHRLDGPAQIWEKDPYWGRGRKEGYWLDNEKLSKEEWEKKVLEMKNKYKDSDGQILTVYTESDGTKRYRNSKGQYHRLDGPACEYKDGSYSWWKEAEYHRIGGPAIFYAESNYYAWIVDGKYHNTEGPAIVSPIPGEEEYWLNGKKLTKEEWEKKVLEMKVIKTTGKVIDIDGQELKVDIDSYGTKKYRNSKSQYHRLAGPAIEYSDGSYSWWKEGKLHRTGGPAFYNAIYDRYEWRVNGEWHNTEGPAILWKGSGREEYWLNDKKYSKEEWEVIKTIRKVIDIDGTELTITNNNGVEFYRNKEGLYHRLGGPAIKYTDGSVAYFINGKALLKKEWEKKLENTNLLYSESTGEIDTNKERSSKMNNSSNIDFLKQCGIDGLYRSAGDNATSHLKQLIVNLLRGKGANDTTLSFIGTLLDSKEGEVFVAALLAALLFYTPQMPLLPENIKSNKYIPRMAKEFGTKAAGEGMTILSKELASIAIPLFAGLVSQLSSLPIQEVSVKSNELEEEDLDVLDSKSVERINNGS